MDVHNVVIIPVIMHFRTPESYKFKRNVINCKEQTVLESIKDAFEGEDMQTQYSVIGYRVGVCFYEYKLPMEVDELGHNDRNIDYEIQRERVIEKQLGCVFIRVNPDEENFNIFSAINQIHRHIKKSTKKSLIEKISKRLLKLEFKSNHSIITKSLKRVVKKLMPDYKQWKTHNQRQNR